MGARRHNFIRLQINTIRILQTASNLKTIISAMTAFDLLLFDTTDKPSTCHHGKLISSLFDYILHDKLDKKFNEYIYQTFKVFTKSKQKISIDLNQLFWYDEKDDGELVNLIVNNLTRFDFDVQKGYKEYEECRMNMDNINMLRPQLFNIFTNVNYLKIDASYYYIFSLTELLSLMEGTTINTIEVRGQWMKILWESSSGIFAKTYENKNFNITIEDKYFTGCIVKRC